jgi:Flp pilus assembly pilin Flp
MTVGIEIGTIAVLGTVAMTELGTEFGTFVQSMMTALGEPLMVITWELGTLETQVVGTTTGDDHSVGITTVAGTKTKLETGTDEMTEFGTVTITLYGIDDGILCDSITAIDGDEGTVTT